jgi:Protein O-mannosyl-transferase TMEM260-like
LNFFKKYYAELTGLLVFLVYLLTVSPAVVEFDCGELATVQATLGIAHPTGYPLFTITGFLFSKIPLPLTTIHQLNILCSVWCALAVIFFIKIVKMLLDNVDQIASKKLGRTGEKFLSYLKPGADEKDFDFIRYIIAILSGLIFAFSFIVWSQSTSVEVYSLQLFLYSLILYLFFKAYFTADNNLTLFKDNNKLWFAVALALGLGFSNHAMTFYLLPALIYLYFKKFRFIKNSILRFFILSLIVFFIASLFYSYLLIRSAQNPIMNFGNPSDFQRLIDHVRAKVYSQWFFDSTQVIKKQIIFFLNSMGFYSGKLLSGDFNILLIFTFLGMVGSWFCIRKIFIFFLLIFLSCISITVNYSIPDIYQYFSAASISLFFFSAIGIAFSMKLLWSKKYGYMIPSLIVVLFIFIRVGANYRPVDESNYYVIQDYAKALLQTVDKNSVIFTGRWDYVTSPDFYLQNVEDFRKDVTVLDANLLPFGWYLQRIKNSFNISVNPKTKTINTADLLKNRPFYLSPEILGDQFFKGKFAVGKNEEIVPDQLLFKVVHTNDYVPAGDPDFIIRFPAEHSKLVDHIGNLVGSMLVNRIRYELQFQKYNRAKIYLKKLIVDFPFYTVPKDIKEVFGI